MQLRVYSVHALFSQQSIVQRSDLLRRSPVSTYDPLSDAFLVFFTYSLICEKELNILLFAKKLHFFYFHKIAFLCFRVKKTHSEMPQYYNLP